MLKELTNQRKLYPEKKKKRMFFLKIRSKILDFKSLSVVKSNGPPIKLCHTCDFNKNLTTETKLLIEEKWKPLICHDSFDENSPNKKFYVLPMFPYPSGNLHMGHIRVYAISDAISRFHRLNGKNVLHPMGFDAFGLPAENAARDRNISPAKWTKDNITNMRDQLKQFGFSFDWSREVVTCSPEYYKFTQFIFLLLFKEGLVYREEAVVNWDPVDKTVLADEQVDTNGRSWRSGALVEKRILKQWFIRTTHFAQSLLSGLDKHNLKDWKDITLLQKHWLGDCDGASFYFKLFSLNGKSYGDLEIWIRYPEMMKHGVFVGVTSQSIIGEKINNNKLSLFARSPFLPQYIPIYVTDNLDYPEGCDSKLGIPCLSHRDASFAKEKELFHEVKLQSSVNYDERFRLCNVAMKSNLGGAMRSSKLRDWLISRQRLWGTPIPIIHCTECGSVPVNLSDLPVYLPSNDSSANPVLCPRCGKDAVRETDTMDTFVDSAWYFLRYIDPHNLLEPFSQDKVHNLMPVDVYIGGKEHAVLHLYYARFLCHFLHSIGLLKEPEPFKRLLVQGMVTSRTYVVKDTGKYLRKEEIEEKGGTLFEVSTGREVIIKWEKMSKSRYNGVDPQDVVRSYGADTTRLLILSDVAPTTQRRWTSDTFTGVLNWQKRIWSLMKVFLESRNGLRINKVDLSEEQRLYDARNFYIKGTTFNFTVSHQLSVAISKLQGLSNSLMKSNKSTMCNSVEFERALAAFIIMLSPVTPHFCSELWSAFQKAPGRLDQEENFIKWNQPIFMQTWPSLDPNYELKFICKVNNSVKETVKLPFQQLKALDKNSAFKLALKQEKVKTFIKGCDIISYNYEMIKSYEATINILIDHLQKRKIPRQS